MKKYITARNIILVICILVFCISGGILLHKYVSELSAQKKFESLSETVEKEQDTQQSENGTEIETEEDTIFTYLGIEDPGKILDWEYLKEENEDIYAWIYIPGTKVDYPILQHETDNNYYLDHNLDGRKGYPGCIYTENYNTKDFSDHNTLIYGHNMKNGTMFHDLHSFREDEFFEENRYLFIYTPDELLVYDIFAAYAFTDAHILYNYDCFTENGFSDYLEMVFRDYGRSGNFREGVEVTGEDHIVTLSTCIGNQPDKRYLLQAVLVEYENPAEDTVEDIIVEE